MCTGKFRYLSFHYSQEPELRRFLESRDNDGLAVLDLVTFQRPMNVVAHNLSSLIFATLDIQTVIIPQT